MSKKTTLKKFWVPDAARYVPADTLAMALNNIEDVTLTNLTPSQMISIFMLMSKKSKILHLNFHTAYLTHLPSSVLCSAVSGLESLTATLDQDKLTSLMISLSQGTNLTYLNLGQSDLSQVNAGVLARGLVRVKTVDIIRTGVDTNQLVQLFREMVNDQSVVKHLQLNHDLSDVPVDLLAKAINKLETAGILTCDVTVEQTKEIFKQMEQDTNIKKINYNDLRAPLIMCGLGKVSQDTLAKAINKLDDVLIHVGEADNEISPDQLLAILQQSSVQTSLRRVVINTGGFVVPTHAIQAAKRKISYFLLK